MKVMVCEICGGKKLVKTEGMFVCPDCGTRYSVEEARKLLTEVEGEVSIDLPVEPAAAPVEDIPVRSTKDQELENLYVLARRARENHNSENAQKFYDQIIVKDPTSWEANFYTVYYQSMNCKIAEIQGAAIRLQNCEDTVLTLIKENITDEEERGNAVRQLTDDIISIGTMLKNSSYNHYNGLGASIRMNYTQELVDRVMASMNMIYQFGDLVDTMFADSPWLGSVLPKLWTTGNDIYKNVCGYLNNAAKNNGKERIQSYSAKIKKYNPSYTAPTIIVPEGNAANNSGCGTAIGIISIIIIIISVIVIATL